ncbi:hypothetical protein PG988_011068 [Apiospora saccharicola]
MPKSLYGTLLKPFADAKVYFDTPYKRPDVDDHRYFRAYQYLRIPDGAPIELKPAGNKGWGMLATRDIARNECILEEKPLFLYPVFDLFHKPESPDEQILNAVRKLPYDDQLKFMALLWNSSQPFNSLEDVFVVNQHMRGGEEGDKAAVLLLMSRFNHSCVPNATIPHGVAVHGTDRTASHMFANVDIPAGAEITFAYCPCFHCLTRASRRKILVELKFECECPGCSLVGDEQLVSDLRRAMLRGLRSLLKYEATTSLITDPKLREDAEQYEIPNSSRFIYSLLIPCFLEVEGLLDDMTVDCLVHDLEHFASEFLEPRNAAVAKLALEQETWAGKVNFAWKLWGVPTPATPCLLTTCDNFMAWKNPKRMDATPGENASVMLHTGME